MERFEVTRDHAIETAVALAIVLGGIVLGRVLIALLTRIVHAFTRSRERRIDDHVARALRLPLLLFVVAQATFIGLGTLSYLDEHRTALERWWLAVSLAIVVLFVQRLVSALLSWAAQVSAARAGGPVGQALPFLRRAANVAILVLGTLLVLDQLGISISPLLAGLGIGGLAVALALQPLLTNLFAGSYVLSDASIRVGDYVELQAGPGGWVEGIGWRATRLRNAEGNTVIVPNATLATATVTNFGAKSADSKEIAVTLRLPFEADLGRAEQAVRDALREVSARPGASDGAGDPSVRYEGFSEGDVLLHVVVPLPAGEDKELRTHELVKALQGQLLGAGVRLAARVEGGRADGTRQAGRAASTAASED